VVARRSLALHECTLDFSGSNSSVSLCTDLLPKNKPIYLMGVVSPHCVLSLIYRVMPRILWSQLPWV
jgi:hypothetical protein